MTTTTTPETLFCGRFTSDDALLHQLGREDWYGPQDVNVILADLPALRRVERLAASQTEWRVREARAAGASWQMIADSLGVSRQAAQQRYSRPVT